MDCCDFRPVWRIIYSSSTFVLCVFWNSASKYVKICCLYNLVCYFELLCCNFRINSSNIILESFFRSLCFVFMFLCQILWSRYLKYQYIRVIRGCFCFDSSYLFVFCALFLFVFNEPYMLGMILSFDDNLNTKHILFK